jgi:AhpD family alkylhydroperoxidase
MAHIEFGEGLPGIRGPLAFSPETTKPLCELVQVLLTSPHTLTAAEREMIATYVSSQNDCHDCQSGHGSTAAQHLGGSAADCDLIGQVNHDCQATPLSGKMKPLLALAGTVQEDGKCVTSEDVERAKQNGATDKTQRTRKFTIPC